MENGKVCAENQCRRHILRDRLREKTHFLFIFPNFLERKLECACAQTRKTHDVLRHARATSIINTMKKCFLENSYNYIILVLIDICKVPS